MVPALCLLHWYFSRLGVTAILSCERRWKYGLTSLPGERKQDLGRIQEALNGLVLIWKERHILVIKVMSTHESRRKYFLDFLRICENDIYDTFMIYRKCITVCVGNFKCVDEISGKVAFS